MAGVNATQVEVMVVGGTLDIVRATGDPARAGLGAIGSHLNSYLVPSSGR
jgi:hypothetical protein